MPSVDAALPGVLPAAVVADAPPPLVELAAVPAADVVVASATVLAAPLVLAAVVLDEFESLPQAASASAVTTAAVVADFQRFILMSLLPLVSSPAGVR